MQADPTSPPPAGKQTLSRIGFVSEGSTTAERQSKAPSLPETTSQSAPTAHPAVQSRAVPMSRQNPPSQGGRPSPQASPKPPDRGTQIPASPDRSLLQSYPGASSDAAQHIHLGSPQPSSSRQVPEQIPCSPWRRQTPPAQSCARAQAPPRGSMPSAQLPDRGMQYFAPSTSAQTKPTPSARRQSPSVSQASAQKLSPVRLLARHALAPSPARRQSASSLQGEQVLPSVAVIHRDALLSQAAPRPHCNRSSILEFAIQKPSHPRLSGTHWSSSPTRSQEKPLGHALEHSPPDRLSTKVARSSSHWQEGLQADPQNLSPLTRFSRQRSLSFPHSQSPEHGLQRGFPALHVSARGMHCRGFSIPS